MGRLRIWSFTALVVAVGLTGTWIFTQRAVPPALTQVSAALRSGTLQFETGTRLLSRQVRDVAAVAARDPALARALAAAEAARAPRSARPAGARVETVASPPPDLAAAAEAAVVAAAVLLDVEVGRAPLVGSSADGKVALRVGERQVPPADPLARALLGSGAAPRHVRVGDAIYAVAVVAGDRGTTLAFGLPIDPRWATRLQAATGADLTFTGPGLVSSLPPAEAEMVVAAAGRTGGEVVDAGRLGAVAAVPGLPALPLLFLKAPAYRARALSLPGIDGPVAVLSAPVRSAVEPVAAFQQVMLAALLLLALAGLGLGFGREPPVPSHVPRELAAAADQIARGDFDARVPRMSGTFGTLASALSRASEAARLARIAKEATSAAPPVPASPLRPSPPPGGFPGAPLHPPMPVPTLDVPLHAVPPDETTGSRQLGESGLAPPRTPTPTPLDPRPARSPIAVAAVQAAQAARAAQPRTTQPIGVDERTTPAPVQDPEAAWRAVYDEFLRLRAEHGEPVEGVTWERFRDKLRKNQELLVQKYACRTVRFQVYAKEGKAALRATPVR